MSWEKRSNKTYYYRRRRLNGRVVSEYLGRGPKAQSIADEDARKNAQERAALQELDRLSQMVDQIGGRIDRLLTAHLLVNGYHRHRGEWRKKRRPKTPAPPPTANAEL